MIVWMLLACGGAPAPAGPSVAPPAAAPASPTTPVDCAAKAAAEARADWPTFTASWVADHGPKPPEGAETHAYRVTVARPGDNTRPAGATPAPRVTLTLDTLDATGATFTGTDEAGGKATGMAADVLDFLVLEEGEPMGGGYYTRCRVANGEL